VRSVSAYFYILRLKSGRLYPGATADLNRRWREHLAGTACRTTKLDLPVAVVYPEEHVTFAEARRREAQVKRWTRAKKEALARGDVDELKRLAKAPRRRLWRPPQAPPKSRP